MLSSHVGHGRARADDKHRRKKGHHGAHGSVGRCSFGQKQLREVYKDWNKHGNEDEERPCPFFKEEHGCIRMES